jgi:hypothetical protein
MDYSSLSYHLNPVIHYLFAFTLLFLLLPKWLFKARFDSWGERIISGYVSMVLMIILSGYVLVVTKLYEVISIVVMISMMIGWKYYVRIRKEQKPAISYLTKYLFDILDGIHYTSGKIIFQSVLAQLRLFGTQFKEKFQMKHAVEIFLFLVILAVAIYIRFYDVFINAAPPLADSYVTLAWMKYIDGREIFHDGIYPQGFHIYLATLLKFSSIDGLLVLRYTGPFNTILITIGLYYVIRKLTENGIGALIASSIYGCLLIYIYWFPIERQVGTNSQEFAFVFIYPVLYFLIRFCLSNKNQYLYIGIIGTTIIGLVHSFAFAFIGLLIGLLIISSLIITKAFSKALVRLAGFSLLTVGIALIPILLGVLLGKEFHSTSLDYLLSNNNKQSSPSLILVDYITLTCLCITLLLLLSKKMTKQDRFISLFTVMAGFLTFGIYYLGGSLTNSVLVATRSSELWGILVPFSIGITFSFIFKLLPMKWSFRTYFFFTVYLCIILYICKPSPIIAYKLEHNATIEQYLKIRSLYRPKTWQIISNNEGYAVSLGTGYHMHINDFIKQYDPNREALTKNGEMKPDENLAPDIFLFVEKQMFKVSESNSIYPILVHEYRQREKDYEELQQWLNQHKSNSFPVEVFYEDSKVIIYHLKVKVAKQKQDKIIWSDI